MVFSSAYFLFVFLPIVFLLLLIAKKRLQNRLLLLASIYFYAWGNSSHALVLIASIGMNYGFGRLIDLSENVQRKISLFVAISLNLGLLCYFKYFGFFTESISDVLVEFELEPIVVKNVVLPIGISFYTFQVISYLIDVYRKSVPVQKKIIDLGLYISMFPQLVAGPIVRYSDINEQLQNRNLSFSTVSEGIHRFIQGFAKKIIIANTMAELADTILSLPYSEVSTPLMWLGMVAYSLQIYFDFSGYSDMAIGLGKIFGFHFPENFNFPYIAKSIQDFWRRWHISLSSWFRDYLYIPLGGSRGGKLKTIRNLLIVFFLTGLWHGAAWNFVVWGLFHGLFLLIERVWLGKKLELIWKPFRIAYTLLVVIIGWVFFRMETIEESFDVIGRMFGANASDNINYVLMEYLNTKNVFFVIIAIVLSLRMMKSLVEVVNKNVLPDNDESSSRLVFESVKSISTLIIFFIALMYLAANTYNPFIYFRF